MNNGTQIRRRSLKPMSRCAITLAVWSVLVLPANAESVVDMTVQLDRHAFYRGEEVTGFVTCINKGESELASLTLAADLGGLVETESAVGPLAPGSRFRVRSACRPGNCVLSSMSARFV